MPSEVASTIVPGSTSNLGPGYDCLGLALSVANRVTVSRLPGGAPPARVHNMVDSAGKALFAEAGQPGFPFDWEIGGDVPISRGLGSSVTLRLGILNGLNELCGAPLGREALYRLCTRLEGHPDNAGPATFGGFFIADAHGDYFRFPVDPALKFVLLVPDYEVETTGSRQLLPGTVSHRAAVENVANTAKITAAIATGKYEKLRGAFHDNLHQPFRANSVPGLGEVIEAGERAGAFGGFLSGSGSTMACVAMEEVAESVAQAMLEAHPSDLSARTMILQADNEGVRSADNGSSGAETRPADA